MFVTAMSCSLCTLLFSTIYNSSQLDRTKDATVFRLLLLLVVWAFLTSTAFASPVANVQSTICSGTQTWSMTGPLSLSCIGDLSLNGGMLSDSTSISLSSTGSMTLDNLTISAPQLMFTAGSTLWFGAGVALTATTISLAANASGTTPAISISSGATLSAGGATSVPLDYGSSVLTSPGNYSIVSPNAGLLIVTPVPLPSSYANFLVGILAIVGFQFASQRKASVFG